MVIPTRRELLDRIEELEAENEDLQSRLDEIHDICTDSIEDKQEEEDHVPDRI